MVSSEIFREIFEQSNVPQMLTTLDLKMKIENKAFYDFFGYSKEEWSTMSLQDIYHPEDYEINLYLMQELIHGQRSNYQTENRYFHNHGMQLICIMNVSLLSDKETNKDYLFLQVTDITEKYVMSESLINSEKKYRLLAEHSSDIIILHDVNGKYLYISPSMKMVLGHEPSQLIGLDPYNFIHPDDVHIVRNHHQELVTSKKNMPLVSYRARKLDQSYIWIESNIKGVFDKKTGELTELISVSRNIQQRIETYELLKKSERLAVVGQMAAAVAHEIRNPLTPIKGFMTLLARTKEYNPQFTDVILSEIKRIETIITEFLSMAKPKTQKMRIIQINEIVEQVVNLFQTEALLENKQITVQLETIPQIIGDEGSLKQVLLNILRNALESIEAQGAVTITVLSEDEHACIKIQDNGCGISNERLSKIGEPFYSTKEKGTGLGLMTCINIIESHHGKIDIESEEGKGTTVKIYIPVHEV